MVAGSRPLAAPDNLMDGAPEERNSSRRRWSLEVEGSLMQPSEQCWSGELDRRKKNTQQRKKQELNKRGVGKGRRERR